MRILRIMLITLLITGVLAVSLSSCTPESSATTPENQVVTVQRGDLTVDIPASGNLALSEEKELTFDIAGTVAEVLVEEGDTITEGQVLVKLDMEEWEEQLSVLEDAVTEAEGTLIDKKLDQTQKEINIINAENDLEDAKDAWLETVSAGGKVVRLEERLDWYLENDPADVEKIQTLKEDLEQAWNEFFAVASDSDEVTAKEKALEIAQAQLEGAKVAIEDAQQDLQNAQKELEKAKNKSAIITAPFAGFITTVNVAGGDEVLAGTVAVQLADPNKFEADILVNEMDISQVKLGGRAWIDVDALPGMRLPAKVTHIAPTATIQSGVVNYTVKVELQSLETVAQQQQAGIQQATEAVVANFQLREGLTVTVSIVVENKTDILLVPYAAITSQGGQSYVQVVSSSGTTEQRAIKTGITDYNNTEVIEGLSEGEQVIVPQGTTTSTTSQQRPQGGMPFFGGRD